MKKWECNNCNERFKTKKALIKHLQDELDYTNESSTCIELQLDDFGINPYKLD